MITVKIKKIGGIFYINGKRLGHDKLSNTELQTLNEVIKELKKQQESELEKFIKEH